MESCGGSRTAPLPARGHAGRLVLGRQVVPRLVSAGTGGAPVGHRTGRVRSRGTRRRRRGPRHGRTWRACWPGRGVVGVTVAPHHRTGVGGALLRLVGRHAAVADSTVLRATARDVPDSVRLARRRGCVRRCGTRFQELGLAPPPPPGPACSPTERSVPTRVAVVRGGEVRVPRRALRRPTGASPARTGGPSCGTTRCWPRPQHHGGCWTAVPCASSRWPRGRRCTRS